MTRARIDLVRSFFDRAENHRAHSHVTRLRARILRELLGSVRGLDVLDVGAGDGAVTIDLAHEAASLTWLDVSPAMLEAARRTIPPELLDRVHVVESTLETYARPSDIVVCAGVLAHVESVHVAIGKISKLTRTGGRAVLELTDADAPSSMPARVAHQMRERLAPAYGYALNELSVGLVDTLAGHHGLVRIGQRRYWSALPFMRRLGVAAAFEQLTLESPWLAKRGASVIAVYEKVPRACDVISEEQRREWLGDLES